MTAVAAPAPIVPHARTQRLSAVDDATVAAWRALARRAVDPNPYLDVDFLRSTHRHLAPAVDPFVVTAWEDGAMVGLLPYVEATRWRGLPVRLRSTGPPLGATVADLHTPLLAPGAVAVPAAAALFRSVTGSRAARPTVVELAMMGAEGPAWPAVRQALRRLGATWRVWSDGERGAVVRTPTAGAAPPPGGAGRPPSRVPVPMPEMTAHLSRSRRRDVRRRAALLAAEHGPLVWSDRSDDPSAVDDFVRIEAAGWKGRADRGGESVAVLPGGTAWLTELTSVLRARGDLVVGELSAGGQPVYLSINFCSGDHWFGGRDVYDERFRRYGPGVLGRLAEAWWMRRVDVAAFDSCVNPAVYPDTSRLFPDRRRVVSLLVSRDLGGRALLAGAAAVHQHRRATEAGGAPAGRPT